MTIIIRKFHEKNLSIHLFRCNLVDECPDASDEKECDVLFLPSDYRSELFPLTSTGDPLSVTLNVSVLAFPIISTLEMSFLCDFILLMRWVDPRLKFYNLVDTYALNSLSVNKQLELWTPVLSFPNARQAEEQRWKLGIGGLLFREYNYSKPIYNISLKVGSSVRVRKLKVVPKIGNMSHTLGVNTRYPIDQPYDLIMSSDWYYNY